MSHHHHHHHQYYDMDRLTSRIIDYAIQNRVANSEEELLVRNVITYLDFDISYDGDDEISYHTKKDDNDKVMLLYQFSYAPKNANPDATQNIRRPHSLTVTKNNNLVYTIQSIKEMTQPLQPMVLINTHDRIEIEIQGYDGSAEIYLFGLVAERLGVNMNA